MARLPNLAVKASKARISFPRLSKDPSQLCFIKFLKDTYYAGGGHNKFAIGLAEKTKVDEEFKSQLLQLHGDNDKLCRTKLQEIISPTAKALWTDFKSRSEAYQKASSSECLSAGVEQLKLPGVGMSIKGENDKGDAWRYERYEKFAKKTEKMNSSVNFTKRLMDDLFQKAVSVVTSKASQKKGGDRTSRNVGAINQMLARVCIRDAE